MSSVSLVLLYCSSCPSLLELLAFTDLLEAHQYHSFLLWSPFFSTGHTVHQVKLVSVPHWAPSLLYTLLYYTIYYILYTIYCTIFYSFPFTALPPSLMLHSLCARYFSVLLLNVSPRKNAKDLSKLTSPGFYFFRGLLVNPKVKYTRALFPKLA